MVDQYGSAVSVAAEAVLVAELHSVVAVLCLEVIVVENQVVGLEKCPRMAVAQRTDPADSETVAVMTVEALTEHGGSRLAVRLKDPYTGAGCRDSCRALLAVESALLAAYESLGVHASLVQGSRAQEWYPG